MKIKLIYIIIGLIILGIVIYLITRKSQEKMTSTEKKAGKIAIGLNTNTAPAIAKVYSGT